LNAEREFRNNLSLSIQLLFKIFASVDILPVAYERHIIVFILLNPHQLHYKCDLPTLYFYHCLPIPTETILVSVTKSFLNTFLTSWKALGSNLYYSTSLCIIINPKLKLLIYKKELIFLYSVVKLNISKLFGFLNSANMCYVSSQNNLKILH
jgi:hypothetical protein